MQNTYKDEVFEITEFDVSNVDNSKGICLNANGKTINLVDVAEAVTYCFSNYDYKKRKLAPTIHFTIMINHKKSYEFNMDWKPQFSDYLMDLAKQMEL